MYLVPQAYAQQVKVGDAVAVSLSEHQGENYQGIIVRTARAIDTGTRTMQVEIRVPNPPDRLIVGAYVEVTCRSNRTAPRCSFPPMSCCSGPMVRGWRHVDDSGHVRLSAGQARARTSAAALRCCDGLKAEDRVILNPGRFARGRRHR